MEQEVEEKSMPLTYKTLGAPRTICAMAPHHEDRYIVAGGENGCFGIFDLDTSHFKNSIEHKHRYDASIWFEAKKSENDLSHYYDSTITSIACSGDGRQIASAATDAAICIWDIERSKVIHKLIAGSQGPYTSERPIAFHPTKSLLITSCWSGRIQLWDPKSGQLINEDSRNIRVKAYNSNWHARSYDSGSVSYSYDGSVLAFAQDVCRQIDKQDAVSIIDTRNYMSCLAKNKPYPLEKHTKLNQIKTCLTLAWHPSQLLVALGNGNKVSLWNAKTNFMQSECEVPSHSLIKSLVWDPQEHYLASRNGHDIVSIWNVRTMKEQGIGRAINYHQFKSYFGSVLFSKAGGYLIASCQKKIKVMPTEQFYAAFASQEAKEKAASD